LRSIIVPLKIQAEDFQRLYQGNVKDVSARSIDGLSVRFPANILRPYVTHAGIVGTFAIHFYDDNRFHSIEKIG
jgi:hypothetical protein